MNLFQGPDAGNIRIVRLDLFNLIIFVSGVYKDWILDLQLRFALVIY